MNKKICFITHKEMQKENECNKKSTIIKYKITDVQSNYRSD